MLNNNCQNLLKDQKSNLPGTKLILLAFVHKLHRTLIPVYPTNSQQSKTAPNAVSFSFHNVLSRGKKAIWHSFTWQADSSLGCWPET